MPNKNYDLPKPPPGGLGVFDTQGHRGCRGLMPENTIPAMLHALEIGVSTLEMDAVITQDKQVILSHEPFFNHEITTRPDGSFVKKDEERTLNIFRMNYDEVRKFDIGLKAHPRFPAQQKLPVVKPTLAEVFDSVQHFMKAAKRPYPFFNIETKCLPVGDNIFHPEPKEFVDLLMKVILEKGMEKQVTIQSFDFRTLRYLHQHYPGMATVMLIEENDHRSFEEQLKELGFTANVYSPHFSLVNAELIKRCHDKNMRVIPWTVNDKATIEKLKKSGVDGIISDFPNLFN
jgi:glycerophosphoryl diester phosphodiesterase